MPGLADLTPAQARAALQRLADGLPPGIHLAEEMAVGFDEDLRVFREEYFSSDSPVVDPEIRMNTFKLVEAYYGGGKTHYLQAVQALALRMGFLTASVELSQHECPLTSLDKVFFAAMRSLTSADLVSAGKEGINEVLHAWLKAKCSGDDPLQEAIEASRTIGDLPFATLRIAVTRLIEALAGEDVEARDMLMAYLTEGRATPDLRRRGITSPIDKKVGSAALRSLSYLTRELGFSGLLLVIDEADRSISLATTKEKREASNNLVHLINQMGTSEWRSTVLIYTIPSWQSYSAAFQHNQALVQRTSSCGFPEVPPSTRIVLDGSGDGHKPRFGLTRPYSHRHNLRDDSREARIWFCKEVAPKIDQLIRRAYPHLNRLSFPHPKLEELVNEELLYASNNGYRREFVTQYVQHLRV